MRVLFITLLSVISLNIFAQKTCVDTVIVCHNADTIYGTSYKGCSRFMELYFEHLKNTKGVYTLHNEANLSRQDEVNKARAEHPNLLGVFFPDQPDTVVTILNYEIKKDTFIVYRSLEVPHIHKGHDWCYLQFEVKKDRLLYVINNGRIVFLKRQPLQKRNKTIQVPTIIKEEYY